MDGLGLSGDSVNLNSITIGSGTGTTTSSTGSSDIKTPIIETKLTDDKKLEYLQAQGYSLADAQRLIQAHPELTTQEHWTNFVLMNKPASSEPPKPETPEITTTTTPPASATTNSTPSNTTISFSDFSNADLKTKVLSLASEYAKNQNLDSWDNLKPEEKVKLREDAIKNYISKNNKTDEELNLEKIQDYIAHPEKLKDLSVDERKIIEDIMKSALLDLQIANESKQTIQDYYATDDKTLTSNKYNFLRELQKKDAKSFQDISSLDREFFDNETITIQAAESFFGKTGLTPNEVETRINNYNASVTDKSRKINQATIIYDYLKTKKTEELSPSEKNLLDYYQKYVTKGKNKIPLNEVADFDSTNKTFRIMMQDEAYQKAMQKARAEGIEHPGQYAARIYVENRLNSAQTPAERKAIIRELMQGTSLSGREELTNVLRSIRNDRNSLLYDANGNQQISTITDIHDIVIRGADVDTEDYRLACEDGIFGSNTEDVNTLVALNYTAAGEGKKGDIINLSRFAPMDDQLVSASMDEAGWSIQGKQDVAEDLYKNYDKYKQEARNSRIRQAGYFLPESQSDPFQENLKNAIIQHHDEDAYLAFAVSADSYKNKGQVTLGKHIMSMANSFSDEANINAQSAYANNIQNCNAENQAEMHSIVMGSTYDEVLELAASNIHNYDESAQAGAIQATYATGNQAAISACEAQLNQCSGVNASESTYANYIENQSTSQAISDAIVSGDSQKLIELVQNNNIEVTKYLNSCSQKDKEVFIEKYCKAANESQLLEFIKSNSSMLELVMRYAGGKIGKEKLFGAVYKGNKGEIRNLLNTLGIKGAEVVKLATTYKEYAPDIAIATENSTLARLLITESEAWGYQKGRDETQKLQQLASQDIINNKSKEAAKINDTTPKTAISLRSFGGDDPLAMYRDRHGFLNA